MARIEEYYRVFALLHGSGICVVCGKEFRCKFNNGRAKYCSEECRNKMAKVRAMKKAKEIRATFKTCSICGNQIEQLNDGKIRRYCSNKCRQKAYRIRNK